MRHLILVFFLIFLASIILYLFLDTLNIGNPFNIKINIPEYFVDSVIGDGLTLNKDTNKSNPLLKNKKIKEKQVRNLVFTSAGDNTNFDKLWTGNPRNYDIMVVYYGKNETNYKKYSKKVDYILKRKGSKFQNFHYVWENHRTILEKYDRFFILDDDIIFDNNDINKMFEISKKYKLDICGPTFKTDGSSKISHLITKQKSGNNLRYTNFIEVNVPLFSKQAITKFMEYYDPILIGWGIDFFYIWVLGLDKKTNYALIDGVSCINPHDRQKTSKSREHNNIKNNNNEYKYWLSIKKKYNIKDYKLKTWKTIKL